MDELYLSGRDYWEVLYETCMMEMQEARSSYETWWYTDGLLLEAMPWNLDGLAKEEERRFKEAMADAKPLYQAYMEAYMNHREDETIALLNLALYSEEQLTLAMTEPEEWDELHKP